MEKFHRKGIISEHNSPKSKIPRNEQVDALKPQFFKICFALYCWEVEEAQSEVKSYTSRPFFVCANDDN
jgi:hypothetical protein